MGENGRMRRGIQVMALAVFAGVGAALSKKSLPGRCISWIKRLL